MVDSPKAECFPLLLNNSLHLQPRPQAERRDLVDSGDPAGRGDLGERLARAGKWCRAERRDLMASGDLAARGGPGEHPFQVGK